jgi:aminoglycoside 3-N-acetyltransferase I
VHTQRLSCSDRELARELFVMMSTVFEVEGRPLSDDYLERLLGQSSFWALAAVVDGRPVGGLTAHEIPMTRDETTELFIFDLAIRVDWQRRGVGRALVADLRTAAAAAGVTAVFVPADNDDTHALDFYRAAGGQGEAVTIFTWETNPA